MVLPVTEIPLRPHRFVMGLDLGQAQDYTALGIIEIVRPQPAKWHDLQRPQPITQHLRHLERFPLGTTYPAIVSKTLYLQSQLDSGATLVVDATGVGRPVVDMIVAAGVKPIAITITGGNKPSVEPGWKVDHWNVPKRDLVIGLQVALQQARLRIAGDLSNQEIGKTFVKELLAFKVKIDPKTAHDSYGAAREGLHDDIVLAVALASWYGARQQAPAGSGLFRSTAR